MHTALGSDCYEEFLNSKLKSHWRSFDEVKEPSTQSELAALDTVKTAVNKSQHSDSDSIPQPVSNAEPLAKWEQQYQQHQKDLRVFEILDETIRSRITQGRDLNASLTESELGPLIQTPSRKLAADDSRRQTEQNTKQIDTLKKKNPTKIHPAGRLRNGSNRKYPSAVHKMGKTGKFRIDGRLRSHGAPDTQKSKTRYELEQERKYAKQKHRGMNQRDKNWFNRHKQKSPNNEDNSISIQRTPPQAESQPPTTVSKPEVSKTPTEAQQTINTQTSPLSDHLPVKQILADKCTSPTSPTQPTSQTPPTQPTSPKSPTILPTSKSPPLPPPTSILRQSAPTKTRQRKKPYFGRLGGPPKAVNLHKSMGANRYGMVNGRNWEDFIRQPPLPQKQRSKQRMPKSVTEPKFPKVHSAASASASVKTNTRKLKSTKKLKSAERKKIEAKKAQLEQEIQRQKEETERLRKAKKEHLLLTKILKEQQEKNKVQAEASSMEFDRQRKQEIKLLQKQRKELEEEIRRVEGLPTKVKEKKYSDLLKEQIEEMKIEFSKKERKLKDEATSFRVQVKKLLVEKRELKDELKMVEKVRNELSDQLDRRQQTLKNADRRRRNQQSVMEVDVANSKASISSKSGENQQINGRRGLNKKCLVSSARQKALKFQRRLKEQEDDYSVCEGISNFDSQNNGCKMMMNDKISRNDETRKIVEKLTEKQLNSDVICSSLTPVDERTYSGGKHELVYEDGTKRILFKNGTEKLIFGQQNSIVRFSNGDIKKILPDGCEIYYFAVDDIMHILHPTGVEEYYFSNTQKETHYPDGLKQIHFSDGSSKCIYPDGSERTDFPTE